MSETNYLPSLSPVQADGIALGAVANTSKTDVEFVIFLAIMLHKAPAAFGLTSFLLHEVSSSHWLAHVAGSLWLE